MTPKDIADVHEQFYDEGTVDNPMTSLSGRYLEEGVEDFNYRDLDPEALLRVLDMTGAIKSAYRERANPAGMEDIEEVLSPEEMRFYSFLDSVGEGAEEELESRSDSVEYRKAVLDSAGVVRKSGGPTVDRIIGIDPAGTDAGRYSGEENTVYMGTPYSLIDETLQHLDLDSGDVVYDLGSGLGRVVIYGAQTTNADFRGIELREDRVEKSKEAAETLELHNAGFEAGNVLETDISDADAVYLFNPFKNDTMEAVDQMLKEVGEHNPELTVASVGQSGFFEQDQGWEKISETETNNKGGGSFFRPA